MLWKLIQSTEGEGQWLLPLAQHPDRQFEVQQFHSVARDRGRAKSERIGKLEWWQILKQVFASTTRPRKNVGYITLFPQRAVILGLLMRLKVVKQSPVIAWDFNLGYRPTGFSKTLASFALKKIDRFVVNSTAEMDTYSKWLDLPVEKFVFCHYQKPALNFKAVDPQRAPSIISVGSAGRDHRTLAFAAEKLEMPVTIVAAPYLHDSIPKNRYTTVLSGLTREQCHTMIQDASVNVISLTDEKQPSGHVTAVEAMWLGTPLVVSENDGLRDYVEDGATGLTFKAGNVADLARVISQLIGDSLLQCSLSENARNFATENYTDESAAAHLSVLLSELEQSTFTPE